MISHKFAGHLNSNVFIRVDTIVSIQKLWSSHLVPLIMNFFSDEGLHSIRTALSCSIDSDECLSTLLDLGSIYMDQNRMRHDFMVSPDNVLKIHLMPRRYDTNRFHFGNILVFESEDYVILNKPSLLPVHPTVDNFKENILFQLQEKSSENFFCIHRLDVETTGLILFAKNELARTYYQSLFSQRKIQKFYKAVIKGGGPPVGSYRHWMKKSKRSPKHISDFEVPDSTSIELHVLNSRDFSIPGTSELQIELLTGKTHQIRAQLSHLGFPLLGDSVYGGSDFSKESGFSHFLLHSHRMEFVDQFGQKKCFELPSV